MIKAKLLGATAAAESLAIEDVFSTYLYTGNGSTQTITNGIDLAGEGGLVWTKRRNNTLSHQLFDTLRGANVQLSTDVNNGNTTVTNRLNSFNVDGFTLGGGASGPNVNGSTYASWTFRKAPRFFDVVTYTGNNTAGKTVSHSLGVQPGCIIVKRIDNPDNWYVYHRGLNVNGDNAPETDYIRLNLTDIAYDSVVAWNDTAPTSTQFTLGDNDIVNATGGTYVAYLFAHDPLGPSGDGSDGLIACGSYTGNGSTTGPVINLGWEPQWILVKNASASADWLLFDNMRGVVVGGLDARLIPNTSNSESSTIDYLDFNATGFQLKETFTSINASGSTYIYIAIRRGPMREPTVGTEVFGIDTWGGGPPAFTSGFPVDWALMKTIAGGESAVFTCMLGQTKLRANLTDAEVAEGDGKFDYMNGWHPSSITLSNVYSWMFRRAPGFFDVVAYTGDGTSNRQINHNLGVVPELVITKIRSGGTGGWWTRAGLISQNQILRVDQGGGFVSLSGNADTSTTFNSFLNNSAGTTNIAYLFASLPGISKVGSYTGNGSSQTINCGFTTGARFILIKRTDSTGDWYVWDTARGIVTGNDPHLSLNTTAAEVTSNDTIDPDNSGFIVNQVAATNVNVSSASYIFYAVS